MSNPRFGECGSCIHWRCYDERRKFLGVCEHPARDGEATDRHESCEDYVEKIDAA